MAVELRPYQQSCIQAIREAYRSGSKWPLLVAPTGAGKTLIFCFIAASVRARGKSVWILTHRNELIEQTSRALLAQGVEHGVIDAEKSPQYFLPAQVASIQTLHRRLDRIPFAPDMIIVDEAHHATSRTWREVLEHYPNAARLGVTATPRRMDGRGLGDVFDTMIRGPLTSELIGMGFLSKPRYFAPPTDLDLSEIKTLGGDYNLGQAADAMDKRVITGCAIDHYRRICDGQPAVAFCVTVAHAEHVAAEFNSVGIPAGVIDGKLSRQDRHQRVMDLANGKIKVMCSCEIVNEGFDLPVVSAAILLRPTQSIGLHRQQLGRVLRLAPGKDCAFIVDHVGNLERHGLAEEEPEWTLEGRARGLKAKLQPPTIVNKTCPQCYCVHAPGPSCPQCGHIYVAEANAPQQVKGELVELTDEQKAKLAATRSFKARLAQARTREDVLKLAIEQGYHPRWTDHYMAARERYRQAYAHA